MKNNFIPYKTRRDFIRDTLLTSTLLLVKVDIGAKTGKSDEKVMGCSPGKTSQPLQNLTSVKAGNWSDSATWGGVAPSAKDTVVIATGHTVNFDITETTVAGVSISSGATLEFDKDKSTTLQSSGNIVVDGTLRMKPSGAKIIQTIRFIDVDENQFVGGGMDVLSTDIGLWIMGAGTTDISGSVKTSWTNATGNIAKNVSNITVKERVGWMAGDEISIAPTESPAVGGFFSSGFDKTTIKRISGPLVMLSNSTARAHPQVNGTWTAEVMNLSRNVKIEGTPTGRAHIFIRSTSKQIIEYAEIRYMGPRKDQNGDGVKELVAGRYGLHFHHCMDGSRGSVVKGNVIRDTGNHCYVPHRSNEILFVDNVSYNTLETSFWWDPGEPTHDVIYDHNIVAVCNYIPRSINMNAEGAPNFSSSGFALNTGDGNVCKNCVVVGGAMGDFASGGAYNWEADEIEGVWVFINNLAHNNDCGLRVWQNSTRNHVIEDYFAYHNKMGIFHGAYANSYTYNGGVLYGNPMQIKAASANSNRCVLKI